MTNTVLVLGASGRFGRNCATAFKSAGWTVRTFDRENDNLIDKAKGADVILNGWNPVYTDWAEQVPVLTKKIIAAAKSSGATVIMPGNVYNFGRTAPQNFDENTSHAAVNTLGKIRIVMESALKRSGVPTIVLRAGDFIDTQASGNWFDLIMTKKLDKGVFTYPGRTDIPHAWAYLPDMARAVVMLANQRAELANFEDVPFPGYTLSGTDIHALVQNAVGHPVRLKTMSWLPIRLISPFWAMGARLVEMSYLWNKPHHLNGAKFKRLLPGFKATNAQVAVANAVSLDVHPDKPMVRSHVTT